MNHCIYPREFGRQPMSIFRPTRRFVRECCNENENEETNIKTLHSEMKGRKSEHHGGKKVPNIDIFREEVANLGYKANSKDIVRGLEVDYE